MRILVAGDTHGDIDHVRYLLATAVKEKCDRVFVCGDFGMWEHMEWGVRFVDDVNQEAEMVDVEVFFLDGNHDKTSLILEYYDRFSLIDDEGFITVRPHIHYARRGHRWTWWGVKFIALGGAYSTDKTWRLMKEGNDAQRAWEMARSLLPSASKLEDFNPARETLWFPEEEMTDVELELFLVDNPLPVDIMFTHDKPRASSPKLNTKDILECYPNQDRIQRAVLALQPKILFHGHLHYRYDDTIRNSDDGWTIVAGLDCNPRSASGPEGGSWVILDSTAFVG